MAFLILKLLKGWFYQGYIPSSAETVAMLSRKIHAILLISSVVIIRVGDRIRMLPRGRAIRPLRYF